MKKNILKYIGFFILIAFLASCEKDAFKEYDSVPAKGEPTLALAIVSNTDSAITVSYDMDMAGRVTLALVPADSDTATVAALEAQIIEDAVYIDYFKHDNGNAIDTITYSELIPYASYKFLAIGHNVDGIASKVVISDVVKTQDFANPVVDSYSPDAVKGTSAEVLPTIVFSEPVKYIEGKSIEITSYFTGYSETIIADSIVYSGNTVSFKHSKFPFNDYMFVNMEEGAFADASGNATEDSFVSGVEGGYLVGFWFQTGPDPVTVLENIFDNFLGDYACTDYSNSDSTTVDWGPYDVTITEDPDVEFGVIVDNFWAWGVTAKFQFKEDGTIICSEQLLDGVDMGSIYGSDYDGYGIWVKGWLSSTYSYPVGHWDYSDFSFDIALSFINHDFGSVYGDIYQLYAKPEAKVLKNNKESTDKVFPY